ncbi:hypothetical protein CHH80_22885 [Bacillus sp. 7504-2]|nr:hypothetical protein CHH80_22885 [Bacillus sp. 7504-2]
MLLLTIVGQQFFTCRRRIIKVIVKRYYFIIIVGILFVTYALYSLIHDDYLSSDAFHEKQYITWGVKKVNNVNWLRKSYEKPVNIAVMDSGVDFQHQDFNNDLKNGYNALDPNSKPIDDNGHGTIVTGIIAAKDNSMGIIGVAPNANVYPVKVLDEFGEGTITDVVNGIEWCIQNGIDIINMSFAISYDDENLKDAIIKALKQEIIIVASASNGNEMQVGYPASYEGVISVAAVDRHLKVYKESSKGTVDFFAPGVDIWSTSKNNSYVSSSGNSNAAPFITGVIGNLLGNGAKPEDIYSILGNNIVDNVSSKGLITGKGFVKLNN